VTCARGPLSEADLARGGAQPSSEADLAPSPRARWTSPEGAFSRATLEGSGGHQGCNLLVLAFLGS
jgi:hypothetical protein